MGRGCRARHLSNLGGGEKVDCGVHRCRCVVVVYSVGVCEIDGEEMQAAAAGGGGATLLGREE